jgi:hypothetical protein
VSGDLAFVTVISSGRSGNVPAMAAHDLAAVGPVLWVVGPGEAADYRYAGAEDVIEADGLCAARNAAMVHQGVRAPDLPCLQLSDDLAGIRVAWGTSRADTGEISLREAVEAMERSRGEVGAELAGVAPTSNPFYSKQRVNRTGFVVGDMVLIGAGCPVMWNEQLPLKEDYDYTLRHLQRYGVVARCDWILAAFAHRTNKGGAVSTRKANPELEQQAIDRLMADWPEYIRPNPRREREVLLRWKRPT